MPDALAPRPVYEAHVAFVDLMLVGGFLDIEPVAEFRVPYEGREKDLVAGVGMPEYLLEPVFARQDIVCECVGDAEPLRCETEVHIPVDLVADCHLESLEYVVREVGQEVSGSFGEQRIVAEPRPRGLLEVPEVQEFRSAVRVEERVYRILVLDRQVHSRQQVVVVVRPGLRGRLQQQQFGPHYTYAAPVDLQPPVRECQS